MNFRDRLSQTPFPIPSGSTCIYIYIYICIMGEPKFPIWMINKAEPAKCDTSDSDVCLLLPDILGHMLFYELLCKTALKHYL